MKKMSLKALLILFLSMSLISTALAQRQTGILEGKISEEDGVPLPGVAVSISGPAMLGTQSFVCTGTGSYRFPSVPPGTYAITCRLAGFKKLTLEGIVISVGKTTTIPITLEPSAIEEEVTVTAAAPAVDTKSAKMAVSYTRELLDHMPVRRDLYEVMETAPGVILEYGLASDPSYRRTFSSHGSTVGQNMYSVDGCDFTCPTVNYALTNISVDLYEEVEMVIGAHPADVGSFGGAYINIVTKSGGNDFHGDGHSVFS